MTCSFLLLRSVIDSAHWAPLLLLLTRLLALLPLKERNL